MNTTMSHLLTNNILQYTQCIACDQELALHSVIVITVQSLKPPCIKKGAIILQYFIILQYILQYFISLQYILQYLTMLKYKLKC